MDIIDKYIYAIGKKLPYDSRDEIKRELKSLLLDEIDSSCGEDPSINDVEKIIYEFGSPKQVAKRYKNDDAIISSIYTNLFFMISKIIIGSLTIAFSTIFIINIISNWLTAAVVLENIIDLFLNIFNSSLAAIGFLTVIFILITKFSNEQFLDLEEDWSVDELEDIKLSPDKVSKVETIVDIFFTVLFLSILNIAPGVISVAERGFEASGLKLGHNINTSIFTTFLIFISIVWILEIIINIVKLLTGNTKKLKMYEILVELFNFIILLFMSTSQSLYLNYTSLLGFRAIFMLVTIIIVFELVANIYTYVKYYVLDVKA